MTTQLTPFELLGPLPTGRLAIEASAGTGKTYALSALAVRFVVEAGAPIDRLLVVTFTRAAAAELRDRIHGRLVAAHDALDRALAGGAPPEDELLGHLVATDVGERLRRVRRALGDFDTATIGTIHGFAQQVLGMLGTTAPGDPDAVLDDDPGTLVVQCATDVLVAAALDRNADPATLPRLSDLAAAARTVLGNPQISVEPPAEETTPGAGVVRTLVDRVVAEVDRRRREASALSFDDLLTRVCEALQDPATGAATRTMVRQRFRVALIDEFQDTDAAQWSIFSTLFDGSAATRLVLVGDPKQAIYAFRGADVHTYVGAVEAPGTTRVALDRNWRSDEPVLRGLAALLHGTTYGDAGIAFQPVEPVDGHEHGALRHGTEGPELPGVSLRIARRDLPRHRGRVRVGRAVREIGADLALEVRDLLEHATLEEPDGSRRPVKPDDIAVLVGMHSESPGIRRALRALGIPTVVARGDSVLASMAATQWRWLLEGIAAPAHPGAARTACLSWFIGWTADELVTRGDPELGREQARLHGWAALLARRGVPEFLRIVTAESGVAARVLSGADGDRAMTDLEHVAELLAAGAPRNAGPAGLLAVLDDLTLATRDTEEDVDAAARRIESDAHAVRIMTVHAAKGLEFPIVCCPTLWRARTPRHPFVYQDPRRGRRTVDVASKVAWGSTQEVKERKRLAAHEALGESLRLLYVALTRAKHQTILWWAPGPSSESTGLSRVLFARDEGGEIDPERFMDAGFRLPADDDALGCVQGAVGRALGALALHEIGLAPRGVAPWQHAPEPAHGALAVATLGRTLPRLARRWSFSAITAPRWSEPAGAAEIEDTEAFDPLDASLGDTGASDEPLDPAGEVALDSGPPTERVESAGSGIVPPLADLPRGTAFGTLVHSVLEHVDFADTELAGALTHALGAVNRGEAALATLDPAASGAQVGALVDGLAAAIATPLGALLDHRPLASFARRDRLDELVFDLPLAGAGRCASDADIGRLLLDMLPTGDPVRPWAERLAGGQFGAVLAGHLTGAVDTVLRVRDGDADARYVVVDYKTNALTPRGEPASLSDYHPHRLASAMAEHHYPLQALLYSVALHRYLRWRLPDYDPARHLGGVAYLFLRGLAGPDAPAAGDGAYGVFAWRPPAAVVGALSDLLDGRSAP